MSTHRAAFVNDSLVASRDERGDHPVVTCAPFMVSLEPGVLAQHVRERMLDAEARWGLESSPESCGEAGTNLLAWTLLSVPHFAVEPIRL